MAPSVPLSLPDQALPPSTEVAVVGGGIVGLMTALTLAERGIPVTVLEKGTLAGEQSSRNLGWIRKMGREPGDLPLSIAAGQLWTTMAQRVGADVGYREAGVMYVVRNESELAAHEAWIKRVQAFDLDSRMLTPGEIAELAPGTTGGWAGGIFTPSDGRAEPTLTAAAVAKAAAARGAVLIEHCAVRSVALSGGTVSGVVTERGELRCNAVVVAGGIWSRRFLGNLGVRLLTLPLVASVLRTAPMEGPTDIAVGAPDFSFRKRLDGGYTITQRGGFLAPIVPDSFRIGLNYLDTLRAQWKNVRLAFGRDWKREAALPRHWASTDLSPFETVRTMDPPVHAGLNAEAMRNLVAAWPVFANAVVAEEWAGMIDVTPDSHPVISTVGHLPGLVVATGFSGHGFGTSPAAGELAADLASGARPRIDPQAYRLDRQ